VDPEGGQEPVGSGPGPGFEPGPAVGLTRAPESLPRNKEKAFLPGLPSAYSEFSAVILLRLRLRVCHSAPLLPPYHRRPATGLLRDRQRTAPRASGVSGR